MPPYMDHVTRTKAAGNHADTLNKFYWDFSIDHWPTGVYYGGQALTDTFKVRCKTASAPNATSVSNQETTLHHHKIIQPGDIDYSGQVNLTFLDFEDLQLTRFFNDWFEKIQARESALGLRKNELYMDATLVQLSRGLNPQPLKKWVCKTGIISSFDPSDAFEENNGINGELSVTIDFEWIDVQFGNGSE